MIPNPLGKEKLYYIPPNKRRCRPVPLTPPTSSLLMNTHRSAQRFSHSFP